MPLGNWGLGPGALLALEYSIPLIFHPMGYCFPYHNLRSGSLFSFRLVDTIRPFSYRRDLMRERAAKSGPDVKLLSWRITKGRRRLICW